MSIEIILSLAILSGDASFLCALMSFISFIWTKIHINYQQSHRLSIYESGGSSGKDGMMVRRNPQKISNIEMIS